LPRAVLPTGPCDFAFAADDHPDGLKDVSLLEDRLAGAKLLRLNQFEDIGQLRSGEIP
jgi:hypothetical protein